MITPEQANKIADELVSQDLALKLEARNAAARQVPFFYRCAELDRLEPWQRAEILREAQSEVYRSRSVVIGGSLWITLVGACAFGLFAWVPRDTRNALTFPFIAVCVVLQFGVHAFLTHRKIAQTARDYAREYTAVN